MRDCFVQSPYRLAKDFEIDRIASLNYGASRKLCLFVIKVCSQQTTARNGRMFDNQRH